ncbi:MAG: GNAT family N-acetyltransferase [Parvibaculaceae bacterium]|nr:GNAT family N-acetyltransferase [Parvibaculaceae bacterium]
MMIRDAVESDLPAILDIYNDAALHTTSIWNDDAVSLQNRKRWWQDRCDQGLPVLVATGEGGAVEGYAAFGLFRPHDGYRFTVENSVYVRDGARGQGVGFGLMDVLIGRARLGGFHIMVAAIEAGNAPSIALHRRCGFVQTGHMPQVGFKFGQWLDLVLMQKSLD